MSTSRVLLIVAISIGMLFGANVLFQSVFLGSQQRSYTNAAFLTQALSDVSSVKRAVTMHYAEFGRMPADNQTVGLGGPSSFARDAIDTLEIRDGNIVVTFNDKLKEGATLVFRAAPSLSGVGRPIVWHCESTTLSPESLKMVAPQCSVVDKIVLATRPADGASASKASVEDLVNAIHLNRRGRVLELIRSGVNVNVAHNGLYPLQLAIEKGDGKVVEALLKAGGDANQKLSRQDGITLLMYAASSSHRNGNMLRALVKASGAPERRDDKGRTVLMHAVNSANLTAVEILLDTGARLDAIDNEGHSALNYAARHGRESAVYKRLIRAEHKSQEITVVIPERNRSQ